MISETPIRTEAEQARFFADMMARTRSAEAAAGIVEHHIAIAGVSIRLRFAGPCLADAFMPALRHLETAPTATPDATFHMWETATTGITMVPPPCNQRCLTDRGDIWGFTSERTRSAFHWSEYSVNVMDVAAGEAIYWVRDAADLPYWSRSSPLRTLFHWLLEPRGCQLLHAACVGTEAGAVLVTGKGGVGKSTTALTCLAQGMQYVADDYLVVQPGPQPRAYSLYATAKLHHDHGRRFPAFAARIVNADSPGDEKAVLQLHPHYSASLATSLPLRAVLMPSIGPQAETFFTPIAAAELRHAAAFTTMTQLPHAGRGTYDRISQLLDQLPGLRLNLGHDLDGVPRAIGALLARDDAEIAALAQPDPVAAPRGQPLVSVIIPVRNGADFLPEAIASILDQGYPNLEILVIDDSSSDDIEGAVRALPVDVRLLRQWDLGPAEARNVGIRNASAEILAFLDVDDLWPADRLSIMVEHLAQAPEVGVVHGYGQLMRRDAPGGEYRYVGNPRESFPYYIGAGLYRRTAFETNGLFDPLLRFGEDTDWFQRAAASGVLVEKLDQVTLLVRRHDRNMTIGRDAAELNPLRMVKKMLDRQRSKLAGET